MKVFQNKEIYEIGYLGSGLVETRRIFSDRKNIWWKVAAYKILALDGVNIDEARKTLSKKNELKGTETLYFYKTSKFPRFKLKDTGFKRCIKPEKADAFVTGTLLDNVSGVKDVLIYESNSVYFIIHKDHYMLQAYTRSLGCSIEELFAANPKMFTTRASDESVKLVYSGEIKIDNQADTISDAWNNKRTLIFDKDLDNYVSENSLNEMTKEDFEQIKDLLESSDPQSNGLGLRLLSGMNIDPFVGSLSCLVSNNAAKLKGCNEWSTNAVNLVKDKLSITYYLNIANIKSFFDIAKSEDDLFYLRKMSFKAIKDYISDRISIDYINNIVQDIGRKVTINIE